MHDVGFLAARKHTSCSLHATQTVGAKNENRPANVVLHISPLPACLPPSSRSLALSFHVPYAPPAAPPPPFSSLQVCGGYTDQMSQVAQLLDEQLGNNIDFLDINCGETCGGGGGMRS
jgi:hypothetical protein